MTLDIRKKQGSRPLSPSFNSISALLKEIEEVMKGTKTDAETVRFKIQDMGDYDNDNYYHEDHRLVMTYLIDKSPSEIKYEEDERTRKREAELKMLADLQAKYK